MRGGALFSDHWCDWHRKDMPIYDDHLLIFEIFWFCKVIHIPSLCQLEVRLRCLRWLSSFANLDESSNPVPFSPRGLASGYSRTSLQTRNCEQKSCDLFGSRESLAEFLSGSENRFFGCQHWLSKSNHSIFLRLQVHSDCRTQQLSNKQIPSGNLT